MDEFKSMDAGAMGDAGTLPGELRRALRRRRIMRRGRGLAGSAVVLALLAAVGVFVADPDRDGMDMQGWNDGAVISIDDPMFDALDGIGDGIGGGVDTRWRAGARLNSEAIGL